MCESFTLWPNLTAVLKKRGFVEDDAEDEFSDDFGCENQGSSMFHTAHDSFPLSAQKRRRESSCFGRTVLGDASNFGAPTFSFAVAATPSCEAPASVACPPTRASDIRISELEARVLAVEGEADSVRKENQLLKRAVVVQAQQIRELQDGKQVGSHTHTQLPSHGAPGRSHDYVRCLSCCASFARVTQASCNG
jgi:hypothetical protein